MTNRGFSAELLFLAGTTTHEEESEEIRDDVSSFVDQCGMAVGEPDDPRHNFSASGD